MWREFEAESRKRTLPSGWHVVGEELIIYRDRPLFVGQSVTVWEQRSRILRRAERRAQIHIVNRNMAALVTDDPAISRFKYGIFGNSAGEVLDYVVPQSELAAGGKTFLKQDVWFEGEDGSVRGVMWLNDNGEREYPYEVHSGASTSENLKGNIVYLQDYFADSEQGD